MLVVPGGGRSRNNIMNDVDLQEVAVIIVRRLQAAVTSICISRGQLIHEVDLMLYLVHSK